MPDQELEREERFTQLVNAIFPAFDLICQLGGTATLMSMLARKIYNELGDNPSEDAVKNFRFIAYIAEQLNEAGW